MISENRTQVIIRKLRELDQYDRSATDTSDVPTHVARMLDDLEPFLLNPERHRKHFSAILNCDIGLMLLAIFKDPHAPFRLNWLPRTLLRLVLRSGTILPEVRTQMQMSVDDLLKEVDPGAMKIDVLPVVCVQSNPYSGADEQRLILIETRCAVLPGDGFRLQALSFNLEIKSPVDSQLIDAAPSSEMEAIGQREVSVSDKGKISYSSSVDGKVASSIKGAAVKVDASINTKNCVTNEAEISYADKLAYTPQVNRIISTAVGKSAIWQLLQTPSQTLLGTQKFSATVLVPVGAAEIVVELRLGAQFEGWGPAEIRELRTIKIPTVQTKV